MVLAENPRARLGHNGCPEDEKPPPKSERIVTKEDKYVFILVFSMLATRFKVAKWKLMEKRKGGEDGRAIRCFGIGYMRGLGFPVWKLELLAELNRKQIGQEEEAYIHMRTQRDVIDENLEHVEQMLDGALRIELEELMSAATVEYQIVLDNRRAAKKARRADRLEREEAAKNAPPPSPKAPKTEAEKLLEANTKKRRIETIKGEIRIHNAVIIAGGKDGAGKEARADAKRAVIKLDALVSELKKLERKPAKAMEALI